MKNKNQTKNHNKGPITAAYAYNTRSKEYSPILIKK